LGRGKKSKISSLPKKNGARPRLSSREKVGDEKLTTFPVILAAMARGTDSIV